MWRRLSTDADGGHMPRVQAFNMVPTNREPQHFNMAVAKHRPMNARNRLTNNDKHEKETDVHGTFVKRRCAFLYDNSLRCGTASPASTASTTTS
jgi:hypothetical protein